MNPFKLLYHYQRARRLHFSNRAALSAHQEKGIARFMRTTLTKSPYFAPYLGKDLADFPLMDKQLMMDNFDRINTANLKLDAVLACALQAENSRDFSPTLNGYSVGLSSGTTGRRGVFLVSPDEQAQWAGTILAKLLPHGLLHKERIAFFLRANSNLYNAVRTPTISFQFFDLFKPFDVLMAELIKLNPSIIVAPASVLRNIALHPERSRLCASFVISVAEVLDAQTRALLSTHFPRVGEVYQATEGFLAVSCRHGRLHLNEEYIHIERQILDETRFVPIITDFQRKSQPIVRYRLDDILIADDTPCPCGSATQVIARIEGRCGDTLMLAKTDGSLAPVFADVCERIFAQVLPLDMDYQLDQDGQTLILQCASPDGSSDGENIIHSCQNALIAAFTALGVDMQALTWQLSTAPIIRTPHEKRRRIRRV